MQNSELCSHLVSQILSIHQIQPQGGGGNIFGNWKLISKDSLIHLVISGYVAN